ncbi:MULTISPECIES: extensin-like domain-containing protein [Rhodobacterales]|uniref:extensin-like domain-containing protein n=1 Tax=Rhodobacterales TaxID=204455 RepID=UPI00215D5EE8|nr:MULTISPECIES: extensin family protein [Rhodobacterales]MDO6589378.1 extensin family protein [Yoonia sp. 1_MG-2023]
MIRLVAFMLALWASTAFAQGFPLVVPPVVVATDTPVIRPVTRPPPSPYAVLVSLRPAVRPASIEAAAEERRLARLRGQVCGDIAIQGDTLGRVEGAGACGVSDEVRVRSVSGVVLRPAATMDCRTAAALKTWVNRGAIPAVRAEGGGVASLRVVSHYACRNRNNFATGRLSEHAYGRAIDIAGIGLQDGSEITVLSGWGTEDDGAQLRQMWRAACGPFGTVLGPEANRFHADHFHFDTARYRSGSYCR